MRILPFIGLMLTVAAAGCSDDLPTARGRDASDSGPDGGISGDVSDAGIKDGSSAEDSATAGDGGGLDGADIGGLDAGEDAGLGPDGADTDGGGTDGGDPDGGTSDGGVFSCPVVEPDPGVRHPTNDAVGLLTSGSFAANPCTGEIGFAWVAYAGNQKPEIFFRRIAKNGVDMSPPVRLTIAPGASYLPRVVFVRDRYVVLWTDQRHDTLPDACTQCREELYFAAFDLSGEVLVPERRLTNAPNGMLHLTARGHSESDRVLATWVDRRNETEIYAAFIGPDGTVDVEQQVNNSGTGTEAYYPRPLWTGSEWWVFYNDRPGSDQRFVRAIDRTGTLGPERSLGWGANQAAALHNGGYITLASSTTVFSRSLTFYDANLDLVTELEATFANTYDGTWAIASKGNSIWVTSGDASGAGVNELNNLGVFLRRIDADPNGTGQAADVEMEFVGDRIVLGWQDTSHIVSVIQP